MNEGKNIQAFKEEKYWKPTMCILIKYCLNIITNNNNELSKNEKLRNINRKLKEIEAILED